MKERQYGRHDAHKPFLIFIQFSELFQKKKKKKKK